MYILYLYSNLYNSIQLKFQFEIHISKIQHLYQLTMEKNVKQAFLVTGSSTVSVQIRCFYDFVL